MDVSRMIVAICGFALSVCLFFSIGALSSLRHAMAENNNIQEEAEELIERLDTRLDELDSIQTDTQPLPTAKEEAEESYLICSVNRIIGVYNEKGDLLRVMDVSTDSLPQAERERLKEGIHADSWDEVELILQDYDV